MISQPTTKWWNKELLQAVIEQLSLPAHQLAVVSGSVDLSEIVRQLSVYGFQGLPGQGLAIAEGAQKINPGLKILVIEKLADLLSSGLYYFWRLSQLNTPLVYLVIDSQFYDSPPANWGLIKERTNPLFNISSFALVTETTFVARAFAGDSQQLKQLLVAACQHSGFSLISVLSPPLKATPQLYDWYREKIYDLSEEPFYNPADKWQAWQKTQETKRWPVGILYRQERPLSPPSQITHRSSLTTHFFLQQLPSG